ncbi:protein LLP homolog [Sitophilus oryzae]|uniref:Protein LLP homolog n=1 Tax=Sitophilus oryzae TaxID=7048 RepID=A0A6J2XYR4_SITOR|nr:protein LLP homolog [Sitophilus oryzae]
MAKSIRSKWKRKCRAVKRERYGAKELDRLKKTLANSTSTTTKKTANVIDIETIANVKNAKDIIESTTETDQNLMDIEEIKKEYNARTLRDKNGAYPIWLHPRKIKKSKKKNNKGKKKHS